MLVPSGIADGELVPSSLVASGLVAAGIPGHSLAGRHTVPIFGLPLCISESISPSLAIEIQEDHHLKILNLMTSAKPFIPSKITF